MVLKIKAGELVEGEVESQVQSVLSMGVQDLAAGEEATIKVNILADPDFNGLQTLSEQEKPTIFNSLKTEIVASTPQGSELDKKILDLLKNFQSALTKTPLVLLQFVSTIDVDINFRGIEEVPQELQIILLALSAC